MVEAGEKSSAFFRKEPGDTDYVGLKQGFFLPNPVKCRKTVCFGGICVLNQHKIFEKVSKRHAKNKGIQHNFFSPKPPGFCSFSAVL